MNFLISSAIAQDGAATSSGGMLQSFMPLVIIFIIFYFLIFRPQIKQQKQRKLLLAELKRGDEVITNGGIYGKIAELQDAFVMLQVASNVTIKLDRSQINTVQNQEIKKV